MNASSHKITQNRLTYSQNQSINQSINLKHLELQTFFSLNLILLLLFVFNALLGISTFYYLLTSIFEEKNDSSQKS